MPASSFITATDARKDFFDILDGLHRRSYPVVITHKSSPQGVLMSWEDYNGWVATMETLSDPGLMESIRESKEDIKYGRTISWEKVKEELKLNKDASRVNKPSEKRFKKVR